jgi:transposase
MIDRRVVFEIHHLARQGYSVRKIADSLGLHRRTVKKYLSDPLPAKSPIQRSSKLDPFKDEILRLLEIDPNASAVVIGRHIKQQGFDGGMTILRDYLSSVRTRSKKQSFIRFESSPAEQCQIDWGHFDSITYGNTKRKLYCMAVIECHSRLLYLEFTHSQNQQALHRCLLNAFCFFQGTPKEIVHDNMLTAVLERHGRLIRFNEAFLEFLRPFAIIPKACGVRKPHEKGKVEKGAIHYIRHNFRPLRSFTDLNDLQTQAERWRDETANQRVHATTGERPIERFRPEAMRPLPDFLPDCRDQAMAKVHSDFSIHFDANTYTVPPWAIGRQVMVKADHHTVTIYLKDKAIAVHPRCWHRKQRIELTQHRDAARKHLQSHWVSEEMAAFISLGEEAKTYIEHLAALQKPLKKTVQKLLRLKDEYGSQCLMEAVRKALNHRAFGADYIENILYQEMTPQREHPPVKLNRQHLDRIRLEQPSLAEYDTFILERRKDHDPH